MIRNLAALLSLGALLAGPASAHEFGLAGLLSSGNKQDLPKVVLSAGEPLAAAPWKLTSGTYYEVEITADGSAEIGLEGAGFFRAIWIDEIVIDGLEIRPMAISSIEFDEAGTMEIDFIAIKPGSFELKIPGSTGENQRIEITIQ